jgi:putative SOS response-associated peptidase YedK
LQTILQLRSGSPYELMAKIHDRVPVILPRSARDRWLDPMASEAELRDFSLRFLL